ncbi:MAG: hypothetical protein KatS3mg032_1813 [Cyclobacteriaceae bacterium]|nr:MAG: hypothetical protein KatS3mg032_1813 [Cyclobacteriaceae bacterium]
MVLHPEIWSVTVIAYDPAPSPVNGGSTGPTERSVPEREVEGPVTM